MVGVGWLVLSRAHVCNIKEKDISISQLYWLYRPSALLSSAHLLFTSPFSHSSTLAATTGTNGLFSTCDVTPTHNAKPHRIIASLFAPVVYSRFAPLCTPYKLTFCTTGAYALTISLLAYSDMVVALNFLGGMMFSFLSCAYANNASFGHVFVARSVFVKVVVDGFFYVVIGR